MSPTPVLLSRREVAPNVVVHSSFGTVPAPASFGIHSDVHERVKAKTLQTSMARPVSPIAKVPVPEMEDAPVDRPDSSAHDSCEPRRPRPVMLLMPACHLHCRRAAFELPHGSGNDHAIAAAENTAIVETDSVERLPSSCPGQAGRRSPANWRVRVGQVVGRDLISSNSAPQRSRARSTT